MAREQWKIADYCLAFAAVSSVAFAVWTLSGSRAEARGETPRELAKAVQGKRLKPLVAVASETGASDTIGFSDAAATLVLGFTSTCPACEANHPRWQSLVRVAREVPGVRIIAASEERLPLASSWIREHHVDADVIAVPAEAGHVRTHWRVRAVPATYIVDRSGRVVHASVGVLSDSDVIRLNESLAALARVRSNLNPGGDDERKEP